MKVPVTVALTTNMNRIAITTSVTTPIMTRKQWSVPAIMTSKMPRTMPNMVTATGIK